MDLVQINLFLGGLANLLRIYSIKRLIDIFFAKEEGEWKYQKILYIIFWIETMVIYNLYHLPILNILSNIAGMILIVSPYKVRLSRKILLISMIYGMNVIVDSIIILSFTKYTYGQPVNEVYGCVTSLVLMLFVVTFEKTLSGKRDESLPLVYRSALCMVPVVSIAVIFYLVSFLQERKIIIPVAIGILFINILIFYLYNSLVRFYSEHWEKIMLKQMLDVYAYQLDTLQESQKCVKSLRHDMKHHIIELTGMARRDNNKEMIEYLEAMKQFMINPKEFVSTGNQDIDGVLNYFLQRADDILKTVEIKVNIPPKFLGNFNVCVILGNIIDNAIRESVKSEEKYLAVNIQTKQGIMFIFVENSYVGNIIRKDNKLVTTQDQDEFHGMGLENVKRIVELNGGEINITYTENRFEVQILIYLTNIK